MDDQTEPEISILGILNPPPAPAPPPIVVSTKANRRVERIITLLILLTASFAVLTSRDAVSTSHDAVNTVTKRADELQKDNARLVTQVETQSELINVQGDVSGCRSKAAIWSDGVGAVQDALVSLGLAAVGRGQSTAPYADALDAARRNSARAIAARNEAATLCATDPSYEIDPTILEPLPDYPLPPLG